MTPTTPLRAKLRPGRPAEPDPAPESFAAPTELERSSTKRVKPLRRWSVAELIANAAARRPDTAVRQPNAAVRQPKAAFGQPRTA